MALESWRLYCRRCDKFSGRALRPAHDLVPAVEACSCGHFPELVSGLWVKDAIDKANAQARALELVAQAAARRR